MSRRSAASCGRTTAEGYEVIEAENAEKALALIGSAEPEVAFRDLGLPDLDGLDVIRSVRGTGSKMPIIVLSSRAGERGKVEALDLGADDYVTKPFGIAELVARIRAACGTAFRCRAASPFQERRPDAWTSSAASSP